MPPSSTSLSPRALYYAPEPLPEVCIRLSPVSEPCSDVLYKEALLVEHIHYREHDVWPRAPLSNPLHLASPLREPAEPAVEILRKLELLPPPPERLIPAQSRASSCLQAFVVSIRLCCFKSRSRDRDFAVDAPPTKQLYCFHHHLVSNALTMQLSLDDHCSAVFFSLYLLPIRNAA
jgi:hypothetical protein